MSSRRFPIGKVLMSASALGTVIGPFVADFNETHIFNEKWMPHAKFHTAQTMSMGVALGLATLDNLWRPRPSRTALDSAAVTASVYHVSQLTAGLYPGTATVDPPGKDNWPQLWTTLPTLGLVGLGYLLERRRVEKPSA
ncbi:DUF6640 family protein [Promicromonospora citrea]|uniref:Acetyltransferase n=1 Tax=Promicromonospora citrea TaxID=43677 RepID=A0A8H9L3N1_9MICO|nr:DUF6640 family protein [Promicromonospora citrea]NNH51785.1 acetyltransferase [Promicromonospora citrea]GGM20787.1 hypothetical protein GCM10010102_15580 [Promicromonospora citrea]